MSIIVPSDFTGRFKIPQNPNQSIELQLYIDRVEAYYLPRLFGKVLFDLFELDLALPVVGDPTTPRFIFVFDPFTTQETQYAFNQSLGIKDLLKGIVYFEYVRDHVTRITTEGLKLTEGANSTNVNAIQHDINSRYNDSIATYKAIQYYMNYTAPNTYPEFEGITLIYNHTF